MTNIKERILYISDLKEIKKEIFFKDLGLSYANFKGVQKKSALGSDSIDIILSKYPDIDANWLLTGEGEMLKTTLSEEKQTKNTVTQVPNDDYMMVEFVDLRATAGYIGGKAPENLPDTHTRLVPKEYEKGNYLVVRVDGDSMDDGTKRSISDNDELLIKEKKISSNELDMLPIKTALFVITTREGNVVKQIKEINKEEGYIVLKSFNPKFKDYKVSTNDIFQIFIVYRIVNKSISLV